jgi:hypothetical protein
MTVSTVQQQGNFIRKARPGLDSSLITDIVDTSILLQVCYHHQDVWAWFVLHTTIHHISYVKKYVSTFIMVTIRGIPICGY